LVLERAPDEREHVVRVGIAAEHRLLEDQGAVDVDVEDPVRAGDELDAGQPVFVLLEQPRRQTGGVSASPSGNAVLDADVMAVGHLSDSCRSPLTDEASAGARASVEPGECPGTHR
jgi:hypothetical protein